MKKTKTRGQVSTFDIRKIRLTIAIAMCTLAAALLLPGATGAADEFSLEHKAAITGAGSPNYLDGAVSVHVAGDYAYVTGSGDASLTVFDISDAANGNVTHKAAITGAGSPNYLGNAYSVYVDGDYAYVATYNDDALTVFDISDIANGNITHKAVITGAGSPNYLGSNHSVHVSGNYAYLASYGDGALTVFDISDVGNGNITHKAAATGAGSPNYLSGARSIHVTGNYAFVASRTDNAITVFDISDVGNGNLTHKAAFAGSGSPYYLGQAFHVYETGGFVYVAGFTADSLSVFRILISNAGDFFLMF